MTKHKRLSQEVIDALDPGVRALVVFLNERGFLTTDSGDGSKAGWMEGALDVPMVAIVTTPEQLVEEARRLRGVLAWEGVRFGHEHGTQIQASYDPVDESAVILLTGVTSSMAGLDTEAQP